jgi:hypothetical protein
MFNFIIATNKSTPEIDKTLDILLNTKTVHDNIILINYNNYSIKYRSREGIDYRHIKQSKKNAINISLPKNSNVVIISNNMVVSGSFVGDLYKYYDFNSLCSIRVDKISTNGKFIESDYRIGSKIGVDSFDHFAIVFNTALLSKIGETPRETAIIANEYGIPLKLLPNIITYITSQSTPKRRSVNMTILVPSLNYKYSSIIKDVISSNDKLLEFNGNLKGFVSFINKHIVESNNGCIVIVNPQSRLPASQIISKIRSLYDGSKCLLFDSNNSLSNDAWLVVPKNRYHYANKSFDGVKDLQHYILSYNNKSVDRYIEQVGDKKERIKSVVSYPEMISIIIPFMYNGDRWPLFHASIERLYHCTKDYDNIEIIVHEVGDKRFIKPSFIDMYSIVYLFSEYHGLFHRSWVLNVPARYMAKGDTLVFFDGDLLVNDQWVNELLSCNKNIPYIGWGEMRNLSKKSTDKYINSREFIDDVDRVRKPSGHAAAAGINVIPRDMFFSMGGWPESYKDKGYGGEDNSLAFKMISLDMYNVNMKNWK